MRTPSRLFLNLLLINLVLISCSQKKSPISAPHSGSVDTAKSQLITLDIKRLPDISTVKLSDIGAIEVEYLPLETTPKIVIKEIIKINFGKNYFLIREAVAGKSPSLFRNDGSFINEVGIVGRGPNEFTGINDLDINPINESIYIANGAQSKFLVFNNNGKFIRTFKSPLKGEMNFKFTEDGILCYYNNSQADIKNSFILVDTTGNIIKNFTNKYPWGKKYPIGFEFENIFYRFNNQLYKKEIYCDTIFKYNNREFEPHIIIDVGNLRLTQDVRTKAKTRSDVEDIFHNFLSQFNLFEFGDFIYYEIGATINGVYDLYSFIGSKNNGFKTMIVSYEGLINDIDGGPNIWPKTIKNDSTIVSWIDVMKFKKYIASDVFKSSTPKNPDKKIELEKLAKNIKETDNPILILIRIKKVR
jgi:hypothetical protein